jgi:hypothetical protein
MAVPGLNADQLVTQTAAGTAERFVETDKSNVTSLKCMTKSRSRG